MSEFLIKNLPSYPPVLLVSQDRQDLDEIGREMELFARYTALNFKIRKLKIELAEMEKVREACEKENPSFLSAQGILVSGLKKKPKPKEVEEEKKKLSKKSLKRRLRMVQEENNKETPVRPTVVQQDPPGELQAIQPTDGMIHDPSYKANQMDS